MLAWERQEGESARAYEAFSLYRDYGPARSIAKVAEALGKSRALLERWSVAHEWVDRVAALEARDEMVRRDAVDAHLRERAEGYARREAALHERALEAKELALEQSLLMLKWPLTTQQTTEVDENGNVVTMLFAPAGWSKATAVSLYRMATDGEAPEEADPWAEADFSGLSDDEVSKYLELMQRTRPQGPGGGS
jgi:hypothetical protein